MSRSSWSIILLVGILALLGLIYASLPMIFTGLLKHTLSTRGLNDVQISIGYPDWQRIRLYELRFTASAGAQHVYCELLNADVEYRITDLLTGKVGKIRVPVAVTRIHPAPGVTPPVQPTAALPLAALISGQWLAKLPVRELLLEQLTVDWRTPADAVYQFDLNGKVRDAEAQLDGNITLPTPQPRHVAVSLIAHKTGQARLAFTPADNRAEPMLVLAVSKVAIEPTQIAVNGTLNAKLDTLLPWVDPWLVRSDWMSGLAGDFKSTWLAVLPGSPNEAGTLMLPPLYGKGSNWQVTGEARIPAFRGQWGDQPLLHGELFARFEADPQQGTVQTTLRTAGQAVVLEARGQHQFTSGKGHADIRLVPVVFTDSGFVLSQLVEQWPYPFDVTSGRLSGTGRLDWQTAQATTLTPQWVMQLDKLDGHFKGHTFTGLSGEVALANGAGLRTTKNAQLGIDLLDVGLPIENIKVDFQLAPHPRTRAAIVGIETFTAELLGGRAIAEPFQLDLGRKKNQFLVKIEGVRLNDIMQLEQQEGLLGSGVLDGQIPVEITRKTIKVADGKLSARAPGGTIRYVPTEKVLILAEANPSVKMVVEALSNFQYQVLDVTSDYEPAGDLKLQIHLEGESPDWQAGQPVHLNLNLEENIPALLRSLQLSGEITERVRKQYQNKQ